MKTIALSQNKVALVSNRDFKYVSQYKWFAHTAGSGLFYAKRNIKLPSGKRTVQTMHEYLTGQKRVDHKDGNGLNNQRNNLRKATARQQAQNRGKRSDSSSPFKGVTAYSTKAGKRYSAYIHVGAFTTPEDAAKMYNKLARVAHGEFARLNPEGEPHANFI